MIDAQIKRAAVEDRRIASERTTVVKGLLLKRRVAQELFIRLRVAQTLMKPGLKFVLFVSQ